MCLNGRLDLEAIRLSAFYNLDISSLIDAFIEESSQQGKIP